MGDYTGSVAVRDWLRGVRAPVGAHPHGRPRRPVREPLPLCQWRRVADEPAGAA